jgi:hypothetical protein
VIVSASGRTLFVHVQKTGGSTIEELLLQRLPDGERVSGLPGGRHSTLRQALTAKPELSDFFVFGFVRNPWARMYSWHAMILRRGAAAEAGHAAMRERIDRSRFWGGVLQRYPTFEEFVLQGPDEFGRLRRPQLHYLWTPQKRADFIGRTERLEADLLELFGRLELAPPSGLASHNAGPPSSYQEHYTPAMRRRVAELFEPDVREFGYEF